MTTFAGYRFASPLIGALPAFASGLTSGTAPSFPSAKIPAPYYQMGPMTFHGVNSNIAANFGGKRITGYGDGVLWGNMLAIPTIIKAGFVLSAQTYSLEVWNTNQDVGHMLTAINIVTGGGTTISPTTIPASFAAFQSIIYTLSLAQIGEATIADTVTFTFTGTNSPVVSITGSRLAVFSFDMDWSAGFEETISFKTSILRAYSNNEQRIQLRSIPRAGAKFRILTDSTAQTQYLKSLIWGWQAQVYGVPWWPDIQPFISQAAAGATVINVDPSNRSFAIGGLILLWSDPFTWEVGTIYALNTGAKTISVNAPIAKTWNPNTGWAIPLKRGRIANTTNIVNLTSANVQADIYFACEVV